MKFPVSPKKTEELEESMEALGIFEDDLVENFIRGSGAGGQKVNKTSSTVQLIHEKSGLEVRCQRTRSHSLNRYYARKLLCEKLQFRDDKKASEKQAGIEKLKRQKRKRSKRAKAKMLDNKTNTGTKKKLRGKVNTGAD